MTNTASSFQFLDPQKAGSADAARNAHSVIGAGVVVQGSISGTGDIVIAGTLEGDISSQARVVIAAGGCVKGAVEAAEIVIAGKLEGNSMAAKALSLQGSAEVRGDVVTPQIVIEPGATFVGRCSMPQAS
jgi:cytoskeletal protein CcmA (bactofilin family)